MTTIVERVQQLGDSELLDFTDDIYDEMVTAQEWRKDATAQNLAYVHAIALAEAKRRGLVRQASDYPG